MTLNKPIIVFQVLYGIREYACTATDIMARRTRLAFLNVHAAAEALPRIVEIMAKELGWSSEQKQVSQIQPTLHSATPILFSGLPGKMEVASFGHLSDSTCSQFHLLVKTAFFRLAWVGNASE